jgi:hypothetical protein
MIDGMLWTRNRQAVPTGVASISNVQGLHQKLKMANVIGVDGKVYQN